MAKCNKQEMNGSFFIPTIYAKSQITTKKPKALENRGFLAILANGRKRITVNIGFIFVNLCKLFTQKWSVLHFGTDHL